MISLESLSLADNFSTKSTISSSNNYTATGIFKGASTTPLYYHPSLDEQKQSESLLGSDAPGPLSDSFVLSLVKNGSEKRGDLLYRWLLISIIQENLVLELSYEARQQLGIDGTFYCPIYSGSISSIGRTPQSNRCFSTEQATIEAAYWKSLEKERIMTLNSTAISTEISLKFLGNSKFLGVVCTTEKGVLLWKKLVFTEKLQNNLQGHHLIHQEPPENLRFKSIYFFSESLVKFWLSWSCPTKWTASPTIYDVTCVNVVPSSIEDHDWYDELWRSSFNDCYVECVENLSHDGCKRCWDMWHQESPGVLHGVPVVLRTKTDWHQYETNFTLVSLSPFAKRAFSMYSYKLLDSVVICRVRAGTIHGYGRWSDPIFSRIGKSKLNAKLVIDQNVPKLPPGQILKDQKFGTQWVLGRINEPDGYFEKSLLGFDAGIEEKEYLVPIIEAKYSRNDSNLMKILSLNIETGLLDHPINAYSVRRRPIIAQGFSGLEVFQSAYPNSELGCLDWLGKKWYFVATGENNTQELFETDFTATTLPEKLYHITSAKRLQNFGQAKIQHLVCIPRQSMVLWSIQRSNHSFYVNGFSHHSSLIAPISDNEGCYHCIKKLISFSFSTMTLAHQDIAVVLTKHGLEYFTPQKCGCQLLMSSSEMIKHEISDIKTFAANTELIAFMDFSDKIKVLNVKWIIHKEDPANFTVKITKISGFKSAHIPYKALSEEELDNYDGYPSHLVKDEQLSDVRNIWLDNAPFLQGKIPIGCLYPIIHEINKTMVESTIAAISVQVKWNDSLDCKWFSKPPIVFELAYIALPVENDSSQLADAIVKAINMGYSADHSRTTLCSQLENTFELKLTRVCNRIYHTPARNLTSVFAIENLVPNTHYHIEIYVKPDINEAALKSTWYVDEVMNNPALEWVGRAPFEATFESAYEDPYKKVKNLLLVVIVPTLIILLLICAVLTFFLRRRWKIYQNLDRVWKNEVTILETLGEGHFCIVKKGTLHNKRHPRTTVAVKILKPTALDREKRQFLEEAWILGKVKEHKNIVSAIGVSLDSRPFMLILEFLDGGALVKFLQVQQSRTILTQRDLHGFCLDICKACCYLEEKGYIHRDISARNVLVKLPNSMCKVYTAKLADFGLAKCEKDAYFSPDPDFPVAWTAPEGFLGRFSGKSDVWSFGVFMWEVFTWGATPYGVCAMRSCSKCSSCSIGQQEIIKGICNGEMTLKDAPSPCTAQFPDILNEVMESTWCFKETERPSFQQLKFTLACSKQSFPTNMGFPCGVCDKELNCPVPSTFETDILTDDNITTLKPAYTSNNENEFKGQRNHSSAQKIEFKGDCIAMVPMRNEDKANEIVQHPETLIPLLPVKPEYFQKLDNYTIDCDNDYVYLGTCSTKL